MTHQVTIYRRGVVRPLDERAREDLLHFYVGNSIRCEWLPIAGENDFEIIWKSGLLQAIGHACNLHFTDYEEIMVETDQVGKAVDAVKEFLSQPCAETCLMFAESLLQLLVDAQTAGMPVLFVL